MKKVERIRMYRSIRRNVMIKSEKIVKSCAEFFAGN